MIRKDFIDRLLVIDDDMMNRMLAKRVLQDHYQVDMAASGEEGISCLKTTDYDALLLDLHMPGSGSDGGGQNGSRQYRVCPDKGLYQEEPAAGYDGCM